MKEMLALGERISNAQEKLTQVPSDKADRAKESLGTLDMAAVHATVAYALILSCTLAL